MQSIHPTSYGYRLSLSGHLAADDLERWLHALERSLQSAPPRFNILLDAREVTGIDADAEPVIARAVQLLTSRGAHQAHIAASHPRLTALLTPLDQLPSVDIPSARPPCR